MAKGRHSKQLARLLLVSKLIAALSTEPGHSSLSSGKTGSCNYLADTCEFQADGECDADGDICELSSDCFDCDPCQQYRFDGCQECTSHEGCYWCALDAICISAALDMPQGIQFFFPGNRQVDCSSHSLTSTCDTIESPSTRDPLEDSQAWAHDLINVRPVWEEGIFGQGIGIRINDDGVDIHHPEFLGRFDFENSCEKFINLEATDRHGTATASLALAAADNGSCGRGIASSARLSSCRIVSDDSTPEFHDFSFLYKHMENMHVSSNSYASFTCAKKRRHLQRTLQGSCPFLRTPNPCATCDQSNWGSQACRNALAAFCESPFRTSADTDICMDLLEVFVDCSYSVLDTEVDSALKIGIESGRDSKGIIYVFGSGNDWDIGGDVNFSTLLNNRYTISVGAVDKSGKHSSYSTTGAALFIVAPGGDHDQYTNNLVAKAGGGCFDVGVGTSYSAPVVSGVVALMLSVNTELGWRDVQAILAQTSQKIDSDNSDWITNAAGLNHSYLYGFGLVDASAAVNNAKSWESMPSEVKSIAESGELDMIIPDHLDGEILTSLVLDTKQSLITESVLVFLDIRHSSRGHLEIELTSPRGTKSLLHPGPRPENSQSEEPWRLMTVRSWGEPADGEWTLRMVDQREGEVAECVDILGWNLLVQDYSGDEDLWDCNMMSSVTGLCKDGVATKKLTQLGFTSATDPALQSDTNGLTPGEACCACGGGQSASLVENVLLSWRIEVYGHVPSVAATTPPTMLPTEAPTAPPKSIPTQTPTNATPTLAPTSPPRQARSDPPLDVVQSVKEFTDPPTESPYSETRNDDSVDPHTTTIEENPVSACFGVRNSVASLATAFFLVWN